MPPWHSDAPVTPAHNPRAQQKAPLLGALSYWEVTGSSLFPRTRAALIIQAMKLGLQFGRQLPEMRDREVALGFALELAAPRQLLFDCQHVPLLPHADWTCSGREKIQICRS